MQQACCIQRHADFHATVWPSMQGKGHRVQDGPNDGSTGDGWSAPLDQVGDGCRAPSDQVAEDSGSASGGWPLF